MADLVIRNGTVVDGTGTAGRVADVAINGGRIVAVEPSIDERGDREIDADGQLVTPGFVDIHTHYDGQVTWDPVLAPSSLHGVTSLVMGNCGVGFAPARSGDADHDWLIGLLEGVEDIPGTALAEGLTWDWESFPDYLDALERRSFSLDVGAQVAHAPLRVFVMGERGADPDERPTADELAAMARLVRAGIDAGALGVTTSRTMLHRTRDGSPLGTRHSEVDELLALVTPLKEAGRGVIQIITDAYLSPDEGFAADELDLLRALVRSTGRPLSVSVQQPPGLHDRWKEMSAVAEALTAEGYDVKTQMAPRAIGVLEGFTASINPLALCPSYQDVAGLPLPERVHALGDPERRSRILAEHDALQPEGTLAVLVKGFHNIFPLSDPVDYEPGFEQSIAGIAAASGRRPADVLYDALLERDGRQLLYVPLFNYLDGNLDTVREMLTSPRAMFGLSDGGAHCGAICDASFPTTMVGLWGKDRTRGEKLPLGLLVHHLTQRTAAHVGWLDRGVLAPGYLADVNVIDLDALAVHPPTIINDLPAGGRRLMQTADGYRYTIKRGTVTFADGEHTGELPGSLVRGAQPEPV